MKNENDFKSITITFDKSNTDVKEKLKEMIDNTGRSKKALINEAVRQYNPNKTTDNVIDREQIEKVVKEILGGILLNNMSLNINPNVNNTTHVKTKEEIEKENLKKLNNKKIPSMLIGED